MVKPTLKNNGAKNGRKRQVVVIGLGRFGSSVARSLYNLGHDVLAIDTDEDRVQSIMGQVTYPVTGNGTNETVLRELGIPDYDAAVVAVGTDLVASVMSCVLLKTMNLPYIVARAHDELHGNTLERIGVDKVIQAESEMGVRIGHALFNPNLQEYLQLAPNYGFSRLKVPKEWVGQTLKELGFSGPRGKQGLAVLAVKRAKDITLNPDNDERLRDGDILIMAGRDEQIESLTPS
tara:strand:- start:804 stop:1505 length:702 start_codon:yes stop_codon:yes gene_type:complete